MDKKIKKITIEACPKCFSGEFEVTAEELKEAEGCIACENCDTLLYPVTQVVSNAVRCIETAGRAIVHQAYSYQVGIKLSKKHIEWDETPEFDNENFVCMQRVEPVHSHPKPKKVVTCKNQFLEDDGFCTMCGTNHFGGERKERPPVSPIVNKGKAVVKSKKVYHQHVPLYAYDW